MGKIHFIKDGIFPLNRKSFTTSETPAGFMKNASRAIITMPIPMMVLIILPLFSPKRIVNGISMALNNSIRNIIAKSASVISGTEIPPM